MAGFTVRWAFLTTKKSKVRWGTFIRAVSSKLTNRTFYKKKIKKNKNPHESCNIVPEINLVYCDLNRLLAKYQIVS